MRAAPPAQGDAPHLDAAERGIDPGHMNDILCKVQPNDRHIHVGFLLSVVSGISLK